MISGSWGRCAKCAMPASVCVVQEQGHTKIYLCPAHAGEVGIIVYPEQVRCAECGKEYSSNKRRSYCSDECRRKAMNWHKK